MMVSQCRLHLHNISSLEKSNRIGVGEEEVGECVDQFGFICDTCCGLLPMPNEWRKDWVVRNWCSGIYSVFRVSVWNIILLGILLPDEAGETVGTSAAKCQCGLKDICPQSYLSVSQYGDREAAELWTRLQRCIPRLFRGITVQPSLLHGDLWSGNAGQVEQTPGRRVIILLM